MIIKIIIIFLLGSLLHFTYKLSHCNKIVAVFSAVNESTWEHIKIGLVPTIIMGMIDMLLYHFNPKIIVALFLSLITIIITISLFYYTIKVLLKKSYFILDISIFLVSIVLSQKVYYQILLNNPNFSLTTISIIGVFIIIIVLGLFTFNPPHNFLFLDPITNDYGIPKKC